MYLGIHNRRYIKLYIIHKTEAAMTFFTAHPPRTDNGRTDVPAAVAAAAIVESFRTIIIIMNREPPAPSLSCRKTAVLCGT